MATKKKRNGLFKKKVTASWKRTKKTGKKTPYGTVGFQRVNPGGKPPKGWIKGEAFKIVRKDGRVQVLVRKKGKGKR